MQSWSTADEPGFGQENILLDVADSIRRLESASSCLSRTYGDQRQNMNAAEELVETAISCLSRYLAANGGQAYMKALNPLLGDDGDYHLPVVSITKRPFMHTHCIAVRDEDCSQCMSEKAAQSSPIRQSPGLIAGGQGPKEFV